MKNIKWILLAIFIGGIFNVLTTYGTMPKPHEYWDCEGNQLYIFDDEYLEFKGQKFELFSIEYTDNGNGHLERIFINNNGRIVVEGELGSSVQDFKAEYYSGIMSLLQLNHSSCKVEKRTTVRPNGS